MKVYVIFLRDWDKMQSGIYGDKAFRSAEEAERFLTQDTGLSLDELFPVEVNANCDEFSIEELTVSEQYSVTGGKIKE